MIKTLKKERLYLLESLKSSNYDELKTKNASLDSEIAKKSQEADYLLRVYNQYQKTSNEDPDISKLKVRYKNLFEKKENLRETILSVADEE